MGRARCEYWRYDVWPITLGVLALVASAGLGGWSAGGATQTSSVELGMLQVAVDVELSCPSCAQGLERRLGRLDNVGQVEVDAVNGQILLTPLRDGVVDMAAVHDVIRNAGFLPRRIALLVRGRVAQVDGRPALVLSGDAVLSLAPGEQTTRLGSEAMGKVVTARGHLPLAVSDSAPQLVAVDGFEVRESP